jgi:AcrR family transcriptional regulator
MAEAETTGGVTTSRGARTKQRLRTAALEAFADLGWQNARVEDIVQRAGVSHGTFYTHYENKTAILDALVRESREDFEALASDRWEADDVRGALERVIGGFLDLYQRDAVLMRTWLQAGREEPRFGTLYREARVLFVERVAANVAAAVAAGGRAPGPPAETVASALVSMVEHFAYCWMVLGEEHEPDDAVDSLVLVWGAALNALAGFEVVRLE